MNNRSRNSLLTAMENDSRTVFKVNEISLLSGGTDLGSICYRLNYAARRGAILNPRKGVYTKLKYNAEELPGAVFAPSYLSFEYVLRKAGCLDGYGPLTIASYLSRETVVDGNRILARKMKPEILLDTTGIMLRKESCIATAERALTDLLYVSGDVEGLDISSLDPDKIRKTARIYQSYTLTDRINKLLKR